jgi:NADH-quinone oxidoreductase subunit L
MARAGDSLLASSTLFGVQGSTWLYFIFGLGMISAFMTAIYMTRMMLYTFHGLNRTGTREVAHLREAPWIMTGPLVLLAVLSAFGGWLNVPAILEFLGPSGVLHHWLEPVVGRASLALVSGVEPHLSHSAEIYLIGGAIAVALAGIVLAVVLLKPRKLLSPAQSPAESGIGLVLSRKYYVDELYDGVIVRPLVGISRVILWKIIDTGIIDGLVNLSAALSRGIGYLGGRMQSGQIGSYAWVLVLGVLAVLGAVTLR